MFCLPIHDLVGIFNQGFLYLLILCSLTDCVSSGLVESENETTIPEPKAAKETIDLKEIKRVDHILASLQRKVS